MRYPILKEISSQKIMTDVFRGYNHNLRIGDGEFFEMQNLTSDYYPIIANRGRRGTYIQAENITGMISKDTLCYCEGTEFVMDAYRIDMGLSAEQKQLVSMGAYVIILPDKKYINTADITDFGDIEAYFETQADVKFALCAEDGTVYENISVQPAEPEDPSNMQMWMDTSTEPHSLMQWSQSGGWVNVTSTYVRIQSPGIGKAFRQYDGISVSGLKGAVLIDSVSGTEIPDAAELVALEGSAVVWTRDDDYIVIPGILDTERTITNQITVSRTMPEMDFVVEASNRLWGCRYGLNRNGEVVNEIYASKLGDFRNWDCFMGLAGDSWYAQVGSDGQFTGAITHLGYPCFFKENTLHKVYISESGAHGIQDTACRGVQRGSSRSMAIVGEVLYYKARHAVCAYDGSLPVEVSSALGETGYCNAVAGAHGRKYYISMEDSAGGCHLFVYDTAKGMWHREDNFRAENFCTCRDSLYAIEKGAEKIRVLRGVSEVDEGKVKWMLQTGNLGLDDDAQKYISRVTLRMNLEVGARVRISIRYDSMGEWVPLCNICGVSLRSFSLPIMPRRCDHFRLQIEGEGEMRLYSIAKTIEEGSEGT